MKVFAIVWIVVGAALVVAAAFFLLRHAAGPASTTFIATFGCIGLPFLGFAIWGLYAELKPYRYERRPPKERSSVGSEARIPVAVVTGRGDGRPRSHRGSPSSPPAGRSWQNPASKMDSRCCILGLTPVQTHVHAERDHGHCGEREEVGPCQRALGSLVRRGIGSCKIGGGRSWARIHMFSPTDLTTNIG